MCRFFCSQNVPVKVAVVPDPDPPSGGDYMVIDTSRCDGCQECVMRCQHQGVEVTGGCAYFRDGFCTQCGECISWCPQNAIFWQ